MRFEEQIYTSAPELLEGGGGNLGVVAQSRGFPRDLAKDLEGLRAYPLLAAGPSGEPRQHPPRYVVAGRGAGRAYLVVSQIVHAGADHTGRTTPLAHHVVFQRDELSAASWTPADVLRRVGPSFAQQWQAPATWIDPPRQLNGAATAATFPSAVWQRRLAERYRGVLIAVADALMQFNLTRQPALLIVRPDWANDVLELIADVYWLLPETVQYATICATHVIDSADYVRDAALLVTYPGTPFAQEAARRRDPRAPRVCDLTTDAEGAEAAPLSAYGDLLREHWPIDGARPLVLAEWDALGLGPEHAEGYREALRIRSLLAEATTDDAVSALHDRIGAVESTHPAFTIVGEASESLVKRLQRAKAIRPLASMAAGPRWPEAARRGAIEALLSDRPDGVRALLEALPAQPDALLRDPLLRAAREDAAMADAAIEHVAATGKSTSVLAQIVARSSPPEQTALRWAERFARMPQPAREALRPGLVDVLSRSARPESMNEHLRSLRVRAGSGHEIIARELYLPALHRRIDSTQDDAGFVEACDHMVDAAVAERRITEELRSLLSRHGRRVTSHDAERWMGVARQHQATAGLRKLFEAASLIRSPELDEPSQDASELPPGVPVGQAPLRRPRGPTPVSVGPIALSMWLALLAGVVLSTAVIWPFHRPQPLWWLVPALPPLGWWVLERVIRMLFVDPRYFSIVRATRWACLCLIVASILLGGWLFWSAFARTSWAALPMGGTHG